MKTKKNPIVWEKDKKTFMLEGKLFVLCVFALVIGLYYLTQKQMNHATGTSKSDIKKLYCTSMYYQKESSNRDADSSRFVSFSKLSRGFYKKD